MTGALLILLVFLVFAALMYTRTMPALLAVPLMAVCMAFAAGVGVAGVADIVVTGSTALSTVFVTVIFGALLGRVTIDTGIARSIVNFAAEFGGERPAVLSAVLCAVVAVLFVSMSGLGAIIMVGSIVLPIMMTTGVPRKIAATLFLLAFGLGFIFNIVNWKFYTKLFGVTQQQMTHYALILALIELVAILIYAAVAFRNTRDYAAWAVGAEKPAEKTTVPWWALVTPVLPIVLFFALHVDASLAFIFSAIYGAVTTRPRHAVKTLVAAAIRGVEDVAPAVVLFIGIGMLLATTKAPAFLAALHPVVASGLFGNPIAYVALFGLLSPLVLYRGPLNPFGVGIAIFTVLMTAHVLPPLLLVAAVMAVVQVQNVCDPTNTQNVWVANFTGTPIDEITKRTLPYQVAVATLGALVAVAFAQPLFGVRLASFIPHAAAAEIRAGFTVNVAGSNRVAAGTDGSPLSAAARDAYVGGLNARAGLHAFAREDDPNARDCSGKDYAAYITATTATFALREGTDLDVGLVLADCGGWEVGQWHDHAVFVRGATAADARALATSVLAQLDRWRLAQPQRAANLFLTGVDATASDAPSYYFSLFKTVDGNMRAFVRAGGPAYVAGLRTNDIVDKIDGKFWWEYGTFQSQARAYDGKPHRFEVERGAATVEVQLGAPLTAMR